LISRTSEAVGIPVHFVEKDFWVTELLRAVVAAANQEHAVAVFKGGTSLSKAYGIIERFSEDVDILLVPPAGLGSAARHSVLKRICLSAAEHLGVKAEAILVKESETGVKRNVRIPYRRQFELGPLSEGILLEMGIRGGPQPRMSLDLRSLISAEARQMGVGEGEFEELAPVRVEVLGSERTLVEKLSLLHGLAMLFPDEDAAAALERSGRHFYDIHQLLGHVPTREACEGKDTVEKLASDIGEHSAAHGWPYTPRPTGGYGNSPVFGPEWAGAAVVRRGYEVASELVYGAKPTFDECVSRVHEFAAIL
jgi:hypothetical protein